MFLPACEKAHSLLVTVIAFWKENGGHSKWEFGRDYVQLSQGNVRPDLN